MNYPSNSQQDTWSLIIKSKEQAHDEDGKDQQKETSDAFEEYDRNSNRHPTRTGYPMIWTSFSHDLSCFTCRLQLHLFNMVDRFAVHTPASENIAE